MAPNRLANGLDSGIDDMGCPQCFSPSAAVRNRLYENDDSALLYHRAHDRGQAYGPPPKIAIDDRGGQASDLMTPPAPVWKPQPRGPKISSAPRYPSTLDDIALMRQRVRRKGGLAEKIGRSRFPINTNPR